MIDMKWLLIFLLAVGIALASSPALAQGGQPSQKQSVFDAHAQVRELATKYRDEWLAKTAREDSEQLSRGIIQSVERQESGWHVLFATKTGDSPATPEGLHIYFLHVYLKESGELEGVVRGPDLLS